MRIIGIDPGLRKTGWGIIEANGDNICQIANGTCDTKVSESLAFRLRSIFEKLTKVVKAYSPDHAAVENTFVNKDATNTLKLGQARGICMLVPALSGLAVEEYAPNAIKKAGISVPKKPESITHFHSLFLIDFKCLKPIAISTMPAIKIRVAPNCNGVKPNNPFFIRIKELPQTNESIIR